MSKDAYYMQHDVNAQRDEKVLEMRSEWGAEGYGLFWLINEYLREQSECKASVSKFNAIAFTMHEDGKKIERFIMDCISKYNLYESDDEFFWSKRILRDKQMLDEKREKARRSANKRWGNKSAMRTHSEPNANAMQGEDSIGKDSIVEKSSEKDKETDTKKATAQKLKSERDQFVERYQQIDFMPNMMKMSSRRESSLNARIKDFGIDSCLLALEKVDKSSWLRGNKGGWLTFDWVVNVNNMTKILEGNYDDREKKPSLSTSVPRNSKPLEEFNGVSYEGTF